MPRKEHSRSDRSPLRRRLETAIQLAALTFSIVLGVAIYRDVSQWTSRSGGPSTLGPTDARLNSKGPSDTKPREGESVAASPNKPTLDTAPPSDTKPREEESAAAGPSRPAPDTAPPSETRPSEEVTSTTGSIKPAPKVALLTPALLDCREGSPTFWQFANVELIDSTSARAFRLSHRAALARSSAAR